MYQCQCSWVTECQRRRRARSSHPARAVALIPVILPECTVGHDTVFKSAVLAYLACGGAEALSPLVMSNGRVFKRVTRCSLSGKR